MRLTFQPRLLAAALTTLGMASACESAESTDIRTSGIYATYAAESDGASTKATAVLRVGGAASNTFVRLSNGEQVVVTGGTQTQPLTEVNLLEAYSYVGTFSTVAENTEFIFNFDRVDDTEDAPASSVRLPATFMLTAPAANTNVSRTAPITVAWSPSGTTDRMTVTVEGDCVRTRVLEVSGDPGTFTINAGDVEARAGRTSDNCAATITVRRARTGTLDPAFTEGGSVVGIQARSVAFRSDP